MALTDRVITRLSNQRLVELTNPGVPTAATVDAARLAAAAGDAEAELQWTSGVAYDDTDTRHHAAAVLGVVFYLHRYAGNAAAGIGEAKAEWREALVAFSKITGRNRVVPATSSNLTASREDVSSGQVVRPIFDRDNLERLHLRPATGD